MIILIYLLVGSIAGLTAGLFGVGGGRVIVPALVTSPPRVIVIAAEAVPTPIPPNSMKNIKTGVLVN